MILKKGGATYLITEDKMYVHTENDLKILIEVKKMEQEMPLDFNYICRPATELPGYMQALFRVPAGQTIYTGQVFKAEKLDTGIYGNIQVYVPETMTKNTDVPAIVLNNGFETLQDGRRPNGNPDYTQYTYKENEVITAIRLLPEIKFEISPDEIENLDEFFYEWSNGEEMANTYLYPTAEGKLEWTNDFSLVVTKVYMVIETMKWFRLGGANGSDFALSMVVRVKHHNVVEAPMTPEISEVEIAPFATVLNLPLEEDSSIANVTVVGGTAPFTYEIDGYEDYLEVQDGEVVLKQDYTENEDINLTITVTDSKGKVGIGHRTINVQPTPISSVEVTMVEGLIEGEETVEAGATIGTISTIGGNSPFVYTINGGEDADKLTISGNELKVGNEALVAKYYTVGIKCTDVYGQEKTKSVMFVVEQSL